MGRKGKSVVKDFRFKESDAKLLAEKSAALGMNESEYIRFILSQQPEDYPEIREAYKELINEVNRIGNNINQIVHNNNSSLYSEMDKDRLFAYMRKLNVTVQEAVRIHGNQ
ncbi:plasmid mobilization relaxosome protein MobC [Anaerobium acetethylicum]|uniref:Mobilisation protein (MobC) n=1 Tax=Anaerobium acetethylicum TaxID=1619234 RepID=A0A1D3TUJ0_9FIRM|nr:plasmid mobilization relaxosome protein MobC [Anaerobium acetethylicum]SCP97747.1 mobilisation protein (MobC) [Anaerobium acetethylicum]